MKKTVTSILLIAALLFTMVPFAPAASAASYPKIPALPISRVHQAEDDSISGLCYWCSMATVQGYCLGTYTYGGITTNYRIPGKDYKYNLRADAITKFFKDTANGVANSFDNLTKYYPVKMTRVLDGIGKNAATYEKIYAQLAQGKPVIVYTGTHASVVIAYNGSTTTLDPAGFTVLEIKKQNNGWWSNSTSYYNTYANKPQVDSATGGPMSCYVNLASWISYCGNTLKEICYPTNAVSNTYNIAFNPNKGSGTMNGFKINAGASLVLPKCAYTLSGYECVGYYAQRSNDGCWYVPGSGWCTQEKFIANAAVRKVYVPGETYAFTPSWTEGVPAGTTYTFYPVWKPLRPKLNFYGNFTGYNYMYDLDPSIYKNYYQSRDTSIYTLSIAENQGANGRNALKIVGTVPGSSGHDMAIKTQTNYGYINSVDASDKRDLTLHFWAKASVSGAKMYIRYGYSSDYKSVALTTQWAEYTISMPKSLYTGSDMHPYFDKAGTFYLSDISLCEKGVSCTKGETQPVLYTYDYAPGGTYGTLPVPKREGYTFMGWYTTKSLLGTKITSTTAVMPLHTNVYAEWMPITYTVTYDANGGENAPEVQKKTYGKDLTLSSTVPTRTGYNFKGWAISADSSTVAYAPGASYTANADLTLYAVWEAKTYTVTFNANGGENAPAAQTKTYGTDLTLSADKPTRGGYVFCGWATSGDAEAAEYYAGSAYSTDEDITLYAVWEEVQQKLIIMKKEMGRAYVNGGIYLTTDYGNGIFAKALSTANGYVLPLRYIGENFGMAVEYINGQTRITNAAGEYLVVIKNNTTMNKYDANNKLIASFSIPVAPFTQDGVTYVPLRAVSEALDLGVCYVSSSTTGFGSYVAISTDKNIDKDLNTVYNEISKAHALGL